MAKCLHSSSNSLKHIIGLTLLCKLLIIKNLYPKVLWFSSFSETARLFYGSGGLISWLTETMRYLSQHQQRGAIVGFSFSSVLVTFAHFSGAMPR